MRRGRGRRGRVVVVRVQDDLGPRPAAATTTAALFCLCRRLLLFGFAGLRCRGGALSRIGVQLGDDGGRGGGVVEGRDAVRGRGGEVVKVELLECWWRLGAVGTRIEASVVDADVEGHERHTQHV